MAGELEFVISRTVTIITPIYPGITNPFLVEISSHQVKSLAGLVAQVTEIQEHKGNSRHIYILASTVTEGLLNGLLTLFRC